MKRIFGLLVLLEEEPPPPQADTAAVAANAAVDFNMSRRDICATCVLFFSSFLSVMTFPCFRLQKK
jgi:hypothetical protein